MNQQISNKNSVHSEKKNEEKKKSHGQQHKEEIMNLSKPFEQNQIVEKQKLVQKQYNMIRQQIEAESLVDDKLPLAMLMDQFINNEGFYIKIQSLMNIYEQYRKIRRDGNCFYRALIFCIFEKIVFWNNKNLQNHMISKIEKCKQHLLKAHFEEVVFEDSKQLLIQKLSTKLPKNMDELVKFFKDEESTYFVLLLRFITSGQIKNNVALYETFIDNQIPVDIFCLQEVQQIDKEADQIQIMALLNYLQIGIKIVYLDATKNKQPYKVILPESFNEKDIVGELLYRPGHYDILYK